MATLNGNVREMGDPDLFYNKNDLEKIRKAYTRKSPYVGKGLAHATKNLETGSSKRNIVRRGSGRNHQREGHRKGDVLDDGSTYVHYEETQDPNYDSEEDVDERELARMSLSREKSPNPGKGPEGVATIISEYKREVEHVIGEHYLRTLETSASELVHVVLHECTCRYEERLREALADIPGDHSRVTLPLYEVVKRAVIKSFDFSNFSISTDTGVPTVVGGGANRMEAVSLLLVELCSSRGADYRSQIEAGFEAIFEIANELNKDVPTADTLISCFLTRAVVDEIVSPSFISRCIERYNDDAVDDAFDDDEDEEGSVCDPAPLDSPTASAKVLRDLQYTNYSLESESMQTALYRKETNAHVRDILGKTKVWLSHDHYSSKLQHIWGIGGELQPDEASACDSPTTSTRELKRRIDDLLMEFVDNCSGSTGGHANSKASAAPDTEGGYLLPSATVLATAYGALKELGEHTLRFFAHEIVKRSVSIVLLNYRCTGGGLSTKTGNLVDDHAKYVRDNVAALHLCHHLTVLMFYCSCGEDSEPPANNSVLGQHVAALAPLPPPLISKEQFAAGLSKFFDPLSEPCGAEADATTSSLFYDVMLDAPHAPLLYYQLLLAASPVHGGLPLLPNEEKFTTLAAKLLPYYKQ